MADDSTTKRTHAERVGKGGKVSFRRVIVDSHAEWPANAGELLEWYSHEVEDVTRAARLRLQSATKVIDAYREGGISFKEAAKRVSNHDSTWGSILPGEIEGIVRGESDEAVFAKIQKAKGRG